MKANAPYRRVGSYVVGILLTGGICLAHADSQVVVPFVDGMTITTSNSVANVEIHAQSLGPGLCNVTFNSKPGSATQVAAPPLVYSPWITIASHIGSASFTISYDVGCDTGVLAEVRYFK